PPLINAPPPPDIYPLSLPSPASAVYKRLTRHEPISGECFVAFDSLRSSNAPRNDVPLIQEIHPISSGRAIIRVIQL
ncbi:MAG: hypothetical protein ACHQNE_07635, partial [Candidatus Kapaibacterium sp.]